MPPAEFEPTVPASEPPQTCAARIPVTIVNSYGDTMVLLRVTAVTNNIRHAEFTWTIWRLDDNDDDDLDDLDYLYTKKKRKKQNGGVY